MTKYIFFSGKGGVGKTTRASATAVHYATSGIRLKNAGIKAPYAFTR
jgi:anion-transporting  ArsA/GET3 family ATPase